MQNIKKGLSLSMNILKIMIHYVFAQNPIQMGLKQVPRLMYTAATK